MIKKFRLGLATAAALLVLAACGTTPPQDDTFAINVTVVGNGTVSSDPLGISVVGPGTDSHDFDTGTTVTLTAAPDAGWSFVGWSYPVCGTATECVLTVDRTLTATFEEDGPGADPVTLTVNVVTAGGSAGSVTSAPAGIDTAGGASAEFDFDEGTEVVLTAVATTGGFAGWAGGDCDGLLTLTCTVTINEGEEEVTAAFNDVSSATDVLASETAEELINDSGSNAALWPAGHVYQESSDLDFSYDDAHSTLQHFAMRFDTAIPTNARIVSATISFTASASHSDAVSVSFAGDASAAPAPLADDLDGVGSFNLSTRSKTAAAVTWNVPAFTDNNVYTSDDLTGILQELVDLDGFLGSLVVLVSPVDGAGTAQRSADSAEGANPNRPSITVEYVVMPPL